MTSTTETARELLDRHGVPEDVIDGVLCLHAKELAAVQRKEAAVWGVDTAAGKHILAAAALIDPTRGAPPAVSSSGRAALLHETADAGLRDRIAEALIAWTYRGKDPEHGGILETVRANAYSRADAVLGVLQTATLRELELLHRPNTTPSRPEPRRVAADRAAEVERLQEQLEEAEDTAEQLVRNVQTVARERESYRKAWKGEQQRRAKAEAELRRVGAEEQPAETQADRGAVLLEIAATLDGLAETDMIRKRRSLGTARRLLAGELRKMAAEPSGERPVVGEQPDTQTREADTLPTAHGVCSFGENEATAAGCIKRAGHDGEHVVTGGVARPECAHCWREIENRGAPSMDGNHHVHWVHVPGGFTPCFPQRGGDSPRAEPRATE